MKLKYTIGIFAVLALLVLGLFLFTNPCKEPTDMQVLMTQLGCAQEIITPALRVEACREFGREDECEFTEDDREAIMDLVNRKVNKCAADRLKEQNLCTDKLKDL